MSAPSPQVLVVGAGPTGLLLATELERRDVPCLLIDALDAPQGWDRATVVHERSLEIFEALGVADRLLSEGVKTRGARFHSDGEILAELSLDLTGSRYGFQLGISEEVTESVLTDCLEAHGGAVTRSTRLVGLTPGEDAVTATLERDGVRREVVVQWVVGCDGLHSVVREAVGIEFPGTDIEVPRRRHRSAVGRFRRDCRGMELRLRPRLCAPRPAAGDSDSVARETVACLPVLDRSYPRSRVVAGDDGAGLAPGLLLPDTRQVEPADGDPRQIHELTHRRGHTLIVLGGPRADPGRVGDLVMELEGRCGAVVDAVVGLCTRPGGSHVGRIDE